MKTWLRDTAWPWLHSHTLALLGAWWTDLGEHPGLHFLSMVLGITLYVLLGLFVW